MVKDPSSDSAPAPFGVLPLILLSGLALLSLLPIGFFISISSEEFHYVFLAHLCVLLLSALASLRYLIAHAVRSKWPSAICAALVAGCAVITIAAGSVPPTEPSAIETDIVVANSWIAADRIHEIKWHFGSYEPNLGVIAYTGLLKEGFESYFALYQFMYLLILAGLTSAIITRVTSDSEPIVFTFLLVISQPIFFRLASVPGSLCLLATFSGAALYGLLQWSSGKVRIFHALATGVALGLSIGCSYTGLLAGIILSALSILLGIRSKQSGFSTLMALGFICIGTLVTAAPWFARNVLWISNPVFPLFSGTIGAGNAAISFGGDPLSLIANRLSSAASNWKGFLLLPLRMIVVGQDYDLTHFDGIVSPLLLLAFFPIFLAARQRVGVVSMYVFSFLYVYLAALVWGPFFNRMAPIIGCVCALGGIGFAVTGQLVQGRLRNIFYLLLVGVHLAFAFSYGAQLVYRRDVFDFLSEGSDKKRYLAAHLEDYEAIQAANDTVSKSETLYLLFMPSHYAYYKVPIVTEGPHSADRLASIVNTANDPLQISRSFSLSGMKYLLIKEKAFHDQFESTLSPLKQAEWLAFKKLYLKEMYSKNGFVLLHLTEPTVDEE